MLFGLLFSGIYPGTIKKHFSAIPTQNEIGVDVFCVEFMAFFVRPDDNIENRTFGIAIDVDRGYYFSYSVSFGL